MSNITQNDHKVKPGDFAIIVANSQHTFAGTVLSVESNDVTLAGARSLPWWMSHMMLTDLAQHGLTEPWRFSLPRPVDKMAVINAAVLIKASEACRESVAAMPEAHYDRPMIREKAGVLTDQRYDNRDTIGT